MCQPPESQREFLFGAKIAQEQAFTLASKKTTYQILVEGNLEENTKGDRSNPVAFAIFSRILAPQVGLREG